MSCEQDFFPKTLNNIYSISLYIDNINPMDFVESSVIFPFVPLTGKDKLS